MRILKHGRKYKDNKRIKCMCGCEYEYEDSDVFYGFSSLSIYPVQYVICPECGARTDIGVSYGGCK